MHTWLRSVRGPALWACFASTACVGERPAVERPKVTRPPAVAPAPLPAPATDVARLPLVPRPRSITSAECAGPVTLDEIAVGPGAEAIGRLLSVWLGIGPERVRALPAGAPRPSRGVFVATSGDGGERDPAASTPTQPDEEAYSLEVTEGRAVLEARTRAGLFYGAQALAQLAGTRPIEGSPAARARPRPIPCLRIEDAPRTSIRGMHLDVARHFFPTRDLLRVIDLLALHRFNLLHWHLTDDQGFRLDVRSHPELTAIGARRRDADGEHAGSYSAEDVRKVVAYARERFITVVPEIEMPGHARAILAAHPELSCTGKPQPVPTTWGIFEDVLCAGNEGTYALLADVLAEVAELFPSRLVHVGGDEVPRARWSQCPKCRARMAREKIDVERLHGYFLGRAGKALAAHGRRMAAWDEALEGGLAPDAMVFAWQGVERGVAAARAGHDVVMAPAPVLYFNGWQSRTRAEPGSEDFIPWDRVLAFEPIPGGIDVAAASRIRGAEGALWTENIRNAEEVETMLFPRAAALAEALWSPPAAGPEREASFARRFEGHRALLDAGAVRYFVLPPSGLRKRTVFLDRATFALAAPPLHEGGSVRFTLDGTDPGPGSRTFEGPVTLTETTEVRAHLLLPGGRASPAVAGRFEKATLQPAAPEVPTVPGAAYAYYEGPFERVPDFARLTPKSRGTRPALDLDPRFRPDRFAVSFEALVRAPVPGVYRFVVNGDDGVRLEIDGQLVVEDDGVHPARESEGDAALAPGLHRLRLGYFQGGGGKSLAVGWEVPGSPVAPLPVLRRAP